jgi:ribosome-binding protein aMBF1 (putative translation factor)
MGKRTFKRTYRSGKLSVEQAAHDEEIRRKVQAEFPPLEADSVAPVLSDPLKKAIVDSRKSVRQLAKEANVSKVVLTQFLAGQRDLRLATAEKLAHALGLKLVAI